MPAVDDQFDSAEHRHVAVLCPVGCDAAEFRAAISSAALNAARLTVVRDAVAAVVELHRGAQKLIVPWPARTASLGELLSAATRYFPLVVCVDAAGLPLEGASVSPTTVESQTQPSRNSEQPDTHGQVGTVSKVDAQANRDKARGAAAVRGGAPSTDSNWTDAATTAHQRPLMASEDLLTDEELAMLMGPIREG